MGDGSEKGLIDVHLGVSVDGVVADVEELDDDDSLELQVDLLSESKALLKEWWEELEHGDAD